MRVLLVTDKVNEVKISLRRYL